MEGSVVHNLKRVEFNWYVGCAKLKLRGGCRSFCLGREGYLGLAEKDLGEGASKRRACSLRVNDLHEAMNDCWEVLSCSLRSGNPSSLWVEMFVVM